jgi:hypothetical protein
VKSLLALGAAVATLSCQSSHTPRLPARGWQSHIDSCEYRLELARAGTVRVDATCKANGPVTFRLTQASLLDGVRDATFEKNGTTVALKGRLSYTVDLSVLAQQGKDFDRAAHVGESFMAPLSSVLVVPEPLTTEIPTEVRVSAAADVKYAVGLARGDDAGSYRLMAHEIPVATYFAFGKLQQRELALGTARLDVSQLDGELAPSFDELSTWITKSAQAVSDFYGTFPVPRAGVTVLPIPNRDSVLFGKVLPESAPGIVVLMGQHATQKTLYSDWILVHELFHLGFPSFFDEGKWLDEGLATYYEPIIRVRAGLYTEQELWQEVAEAMPQGVPAFTELGLEHADDFRGIYWGGALASLIADVEARKRDPKRGLEVGLRALREAGGNACEVWSLSDAITTIDRALGAPTLAPIAAAHAQQGAPFDFEGLLRDLGVVRIAYDRIRLSDQAPLSAVRRAITAKP